MTSEERQELVEALSHQSHKVIVVGCSDIRFTGMLHKEQSDIGAVILNTKPSVTVVDESKTLGENIKLVFKNRITFNPLPEGKVARRMRRKQERKHK